jgi:phytoene dehydrogenase-like protein
MTVFDVAIVGGGHNGLTCAAYLAKAGLSVKVLERRPIVGGAAVTEEFFLGFRNSVAAYTVSLLNPKIIRDLDLARHGLTIVERRALNFLPFADGRYLIAGEGRTQAEIAKFSARDAERYAAYNARLNTVADVLRAMVLEPPPNIDEGWTLRSLIEMLRLARMGKRMHGLSQSDRQALLDLFTQSAADYLDGWFESDPPKALFGFDAVVGNYASPYTPGTAYVLLHHCFGEVNGKPGVWGHAVGGMGAITQAMCAAAQARGVVIRTNATVAKVMTAEGRASGVVLASGEVIKARAVAANVPPKLLFRDLVQEAAIEPDLRARFTCMKTGSGTFRMNVALAELQDFLCRPGKEPQPHHGSGIIIGPTISYLERAYLDARLHGWSLEPVVEMLIPTTLEPALAPPGRHVASLFVQHVAPQLPDGRSWDDAKDGFADLVIETVNRHAPNFKASVIARQVLSPLDIERRFGMIDGDIFHGQLSLDQLFSARPVLGHADYRMPVPGLYLCGSGAHPGGGVTGAPGHNAAREIIRDLRGWFRRQ